ncbi:hypothetical protein F4781DRAFT_427211 [Annulohypoxylon bovei var. microspora]|nr:hypothetical protein F4781DRAFT_427211 [Annulohypoxylon bovei var. microspora]
MNTTVGIAHKQLDGWQDDVSPWAPTMFTSPFGENVPPIPDSQFWGSPGNSSEEYCRTGSHSTRDEYRHSFDTSDNFESGYTINAASGARPPGFDQDALSYNYNHHSALQMTGLSDPRQHIDPFVPREIGRHYSEEDDDDDDAAAQNFQAADDEGLFDGSLASSTPTVTSKRHSASSSAMRTPGSVTSPWEWGGDQQSPLTTTGGRNTTRTHSHSTADTPTDVRAGGKPNKSRRNRERNRVAAHKCRQKAKQSMTDLQARERELSQQNRLLQEHAGSLRDEILDLKNEILRHSDCNSDIIQNYIVRAARDVN